MPLPIKYAFSATSYDNAVRLGNIALGVNAVDYGPSTTTGWTNAVPALNGGYAIYYFSGTNIRMRTAVDDATLITVAGQIMGTTYTSVSGSLIGLTGGGFTPVSVNPPNTVTSGSVLNLNAGLVMSYPRGGTTWYDINGSNNSINGSLNNGPTFNSTNNSLAFDGTDDNVSTSYNSAVAFLNTSPYTLEVLVNAQSQINYPGFMNRESNVGLGRDGYNLIYTLVGQSAGQVFVFSERFTTGTSTFAGFTTATSSFFNNWHHVLSTYDGSMVRIYYDGVLQGSGSSTGNITNASKALEIANRNGAVLKGNLSYARVYNRALSQSEILQNYYQGNIVTSSLTMALDAGNLVSYPGSGTAWTTLTGSNSGTLANGPTFSSANGGAIVFDGTNDYIDCGTFSQFNGNGDKSLEVWFKPTGTLSAPVVQAGTQGSTGLDFEITYVVEGAVGASTNIPAQYKNLGGIYGAFWAEDIFIPISYTGSVKNNWQQVVLTLSGGNIGSLFYNGTLPQALKWDGSNWSQTLQSQPFTFNSVSTGANQPLYIGRASTYSPWGAGQLYFPGNIAIVRAYNKALSASEVFQNFNAQRNRFNL
jgi:hypothetical protein